MNRIKIPKLVFVLIFLLPVFLLSCQAASAQTGLKTVSPDVFFDTLEQSRADGPVVILDVRTPGEFQGGHAPGAINIDFYSPDFSSQLSRLDKSQSYFIYCNSGNRSGQALKAMDKLGFSEVYDLSGGWSRSSSRLLNLE